MVTAFSGVNNGHFPTSATNDCIIGPNGEITRWMLITPDIAKSFLEKNFENNRNRIRSVTGRYTTDMKRGDWQVTHQGIAFDESGFMIDGQHRCIGVIESGVSIWMLVTVKLTRYAANAMDRHKSRTLVHTLHMLDYEHSDHRTVAISRRMMLGPVHVSAAQKLQNGNYLTESQMIEFINVHSEAIMFARNEARNTDGPAAFAAAIGRAFYHADDQELRRFLNAMRDQIPAGDIQPRDKCARMLRAFFDRTPCGGGYSQVIVYQKSQCAIYAFLKGESLSKIMGSEKDLFPLPITQSEQG